jgi:hypothetical protein
VRALRFHKTVSIPSSASVGFGNGALGIGSIYDEHRIKSTITVVV